MHSKHAVSVTHMGWRQEKQWGVCGAQIKVTYPYSVLLDSMVVQGPCQQISHEPSDSKRGHKDKTSV